MIGKAYAFFDCKAEIEEIREHLPKITDGWSHKAFGLELILDELKAFLIKDELDSDLLRYVNESEICSIGGSEKGDLVKLSSLKYVIEAHYANETNEETGNILEMVMNGVYMRFGKNKPFYVDVVFG